MVTFWYVSPGRLAGLSLQSIMLLMRMKSEMALRRAVYCLANTWLRQPPWYVPRSITSLVYMLGQNSIAM
ncbi:MAG: hypothetical protein DCC68_07725 [Planctomycetota bacterium]|nr:MAG: hypothetical protein DCC68_07725 [Planctomycetota bacterium]